MGVLCLISATASHMWIPETKEGTIPDVLYVKPKESQGTRPKGCQIGVTKELP